MSKFWLLKRGRTYQVFTQPVDQSAFENPPPQELCQTLLESDGPIASQLGTKDYVVVEQPRGTPPPSGTAKLTPEQFREHAATLGVPQDRIDAMLGNLAQPKPVLNEGLTFPLTSSAVQEDLRQIITSNELVQRTLQEFRVLVAEGNKASIEAVGTFLMTVEPDLEPELLKIATSPTKKRFSFG